MTTAATSNRQSLTPSFVDTYELRKPDGISTALYLHRPTISYVEITSVLSISRPEKLSVHLDLKGVC